MRVSQQLTKTLRETPRDSEGGNQELLVRAVISQRSLKNGGVEIKLRSQKESRVVPLADAVQVIRMRFAGGWELHEI